MASASGMEWLTAKYSHSNTPWVLRWPSATTIISGVIRCSRHFSATRARVNRDPTIGMSERSLSRNGMAPMWSSCAWVSTSASMSSRRSSMWRKSGRIRSTPGSSWLGNSTPQSTISRRPRCSKTVILRPISPMPPSAVTRSAPGSSGGGALRSSIMSAAHWPPACRRPARRVAQRWRASAASGGRRPRSPAASVRPWTASHRPAGSAHRSAGPA